MRQRSSEVLVYLKDRGTTSSSRNRVRVELLTGNGAGPVPVRAAVRFCSPPLGLRVSRTTRLATCATLDVVLNVVLDCDMPTEISYDSLPRIQAGRSRRGKSIYPPANIPLSSLKGFMERA